MGLIDRFTSVPWGTLALSTTLAVMTLVAIAGFGAPAWILVPVSWATVAIYGATVSWAERTHRHTR